MINPKINAERIIESLKKKLYEYDDNLYKKSFNEMIKKSAILQCDASIEAITDYNKSLNKIKGESESEALVLEGKIKFLIDTKKEIEKIIS